MCSGDSSKQSCCLATPQIDRTRFSDWLVTKRAQDNVVDAFCAGYRTVANLIELSDFIEPQEFHEKVRHFLYQTDSTESDQADQELRRVWTKAFDELSKGEVGDQTS